MRGVDNDSFATNQSYAAVRTKNMFQYLLAPPPTTTVTFVFFSSFFRFGSRSGYVRGWEHSLAGTGVHGRLSVARHRGASSGGKRDPRGEHDGLSLQAPEDAANNRLRRCRGRMKGLLKGPGQLSARERKKGWRGLRLLHTGMLHVVGVRIQAELAGLSFFFSVLLCSFCFCPVFFLSVSHCRAVA